MGYSTKFKGKFRLNRKLTSQESLYLHTFSECRRVALSEDACYLYEDPIREAVGLPPGKEGEFCVFYSENPYQYKGNFYLNGSDSQEPSTQPSLWCGWIPNKTDDAIIWNGIEKFYSYETWLIYLVNNFFIPWGIVLNGDVEYQGEERNDYGILSVKDNFYENIFQPPNKTVELHEVGFYDTPWPTITK